MSQYDLLSDVFVSLRLTGNLYFRAELAGEWAVELTAERRHIRFHLVRHGRCWITLPGGGDPVELREGDLAVVPHGTGQILSDAPGRPPVKLDDVLASGAVDNAGLLTFGSGTGRVSLLCGFCTFDEAVTHPIIAGLPPLVVVSPRDLGGEPWLGETLRLMTLESDLAGQGMTGVLTRLLEVVLLQTVRRHHHDGAGGYVAALADRHLAQALAAIHTAPDHPWTVAGLAAYCGLSRAVFAERFKALVGVPPNAYLTNWRLMQARRLLRESRLAVDEIARRCGYRSLPSFTRRFKAEYGLGPGAYRRNRT